MGDLLDDLAELGSDEEEIINILPVGTKQGVSFGLDPNSKEGEAMEDGESGEEDSSDGEDIADVREFSGSKHGRKRNREEEIPVDDELEAELAAVSSGGKTGLGSVAKLRSTARFREHMRNVDEYLSKGSQVESVVGSLEEWPEYRLVVACNALLTALDDELHAVHRYTVELYAPRFPELERLVPTAKEYIRTVATIGNASDLTALDLTQILPSATVMLVTVTGSTTAGKPLPPPALAAVMSSIEEWEALLSAREKILSFVETRMGVMAPNVCALLGARVSALLVACAGGLTALSRSPSCNVQVMGSKKRVASRPGNITSIAPGTTVVTRHAGVLWDAPVVANAPPALARKTAKVLAGKVVLAARLDAFSGEKGAGAAFLAEIEDKIAKWCEPPPARAHKPLPAPDEGAGKKRRGGRKARAYKEKMGITEVRKEANRLAVTDAGVGDYDNAAMGLDRGMLGTGATATGRMRVGRKGSQKGLTILRKGVGGAGGGGSMSAGVGGGALTSFAMTSVKGMQLAAGAWTGMAPAPQVSKTSEYFNASGAFTALPGAGVKRG